MNDQNFGERFDSPAFAERKTEFPMAVTPEPSFNNAPTLASLVEQTPVGVYVPVSDLQENTLVNNNPSNEPTAIPEPITGDTTTSVAPMPLSAYPLPNVENIESSSALLNRDETEKLRARWVEIQGKFVDEPRSAVEQADLLVSDVIEILSRMFSTEQGSLENQWKQGKDVSTEDLRKALQKYRAFFNRLVV